jgi:hypothetical protein
MLLTEDLKKNVYIDTHARVHAFMHVYVRAFVYMVLSLQTHIYTHTYKHTKTYIHMAQHHSETHCRHVHFRMTNSCDNSREKHLCSVPLSGACIVFAWLYPQPFPTESDTSRTSRP